MQKKVVDEASHSVDWASEKTTSIIKAFAQTSFFKKAEQLAVDGSEKAFGKENAMAMLSKVKACIPESWKACQKLEIESIDGSQ